MRAVGSTGRARRRPRPRYAGSPGGAPENGDIRAQDGSRAAETALARGNAPRRVLCEGSRSCRKRKSHCVVLDSGRIHRESARARAQVAGCRCPALAVMSPPPGGWAPLIGWRDTPAPWGCGGRPVGAVGSSRTLAAQLVRGCLPDYGATSLGRSRIATMGFEVVARTAHATSMRSRHGARR